MDYKILELKCQIELPKNSREKKKNATMVQSKTFYYFKKTENEVIKFIQKKWGLKCDFHLSRNISTKH